MASIARSVAGVIVLASLAAPAAASTFSFAQLYIDTAYGGNGKPGWVQAGDIDRDGDLDIVAGGGNALFVYENDGAARGWVRHGTLDGSGDIGCNGAELYDVDGDGDLDVVAAKYTAELGWWQNPGGALATTAWTFHRLGGGTSGWFLHDLIRGDLDRDGRAEEFVAVLQSGYWNAPFHVWWYRPGSDPFGDWERHEITTNQAGPNNNHAGVDIADLDRDGDADVSFSNGWFESDGDPAGIWTWRSVTDLYGISNSLMRDLDGDDDLDLVMSAGHHGEGLYWFENTGDPVAGPWLQHTVDDLLHHPEGLQIEDLDRDGDLDIVAAELFFGEDPGEPDWSDQAHNLYVYENLGGAPPTFAEHNIAPLSWPSHLPYLVDVDRDGWLDIISESTGYQVISYYENQQGPDCVSADLAVVPTLYARKLEAPARTLLELSWGQAPGAAQYHVTRVTDATLLASGNVDPMTPRQTPAGQGELVCWRLAPGDVCQDYTAFDRSESPQFFQVLAACGPDGSSEGPF